jgi:hypothetical protein
MTDSTERRLDRPAGRRARPGQPVRVRVAVLELRVAEGEDLVEVRVGQVREEAVVERLQLLCSARAAVGVDEDDRLTLAHLGQLVDAVGLSDVTRRVAVEVAASRGAAGPAGLPEPLGAKLDRPAGRLDRVSAELDRRGGDGGPSARRHERKCSGRDGGEHSDASGHVSPLPLERLARPRARRSAFDATESRLGRPSSVRSTLRRISRPSVGQTGQRRR